MATLPSTQQLSMVNWKAVHELLRLGGKASMTKVADIYGTPLHLAALGGHKGVVLALLDEGCHIDVVDSNSQSVIHFAAQRWSC